MNHHISKVIKKNLLFNKTINKKNFNLVNSSINTLMNKLIGGTSTNLKIKYMNELYKFEKVEDDISEIYILYSNKEENCIANNGENALFILPTIKNVAPICILL